MLDPAEAAVKMMIQVLHCGISGHTELRSTGRCTAAEIADLAPLIYVHVFRGAKRQFLELDDETKFKMSGHSARICLHFSKSAQVKIDVTPHEKRVHSRFGPFSASFDKRSQDPSLSAECAPQTGARA